MKDEKDGKQIFILHFSLIINQVFLNYQVFYNKVLTFHGILSHVKLQQFLYRIGFTERNLLQTHVLSDNPRNSSGEISPKPLNRVISGLGASFSMAARRSSSE